MKQRTFVLIIKTTFAASEKGSMCFMGNKTPLLSQSALFTLWLPTDQTNPFENLGKLLAFNLILTADLKLEKT